MTGFPRDPFMLRGTPAPAVTMPDGVPAAAAPQLILDACSQASAAVGVPFSMAFLTTLVGLGISCQANAVVEVMAGFQHPLHIHALGIGLTAERKSSLIRLILAPIFDFADEPDSRLTLLADAPPGSLLDELALGGVNIIVDEPMSLFKEDTLEIAAAILAQGWDDSTLRIVRRGRRLSFKAGLSLLYMMQPESMLRLKAAKYGALRRKGVLSRQLAVWPASAKGFRWIVEDPQLDQVHVLQQRMRDLLRDCVVGRERRVIKPNRSAFTAWKVWANRIEGGLQPHGPWIDVADFASRAAGYAMRIACLYHLLQGHEGDIPLETMLMATHAMDYFLQQAKLIFGDLGLLSEVRKDAEQLGRYLTRRYALNGIWVISKSTIRETCHIRNSARLHAALEILQHDGFLTSTYHEGKIKDVHLTPGSLLF